MGSTLLTSGSSLEKVAEVRKVKEGSGIKKPRTFVRGFMVWLAKLSAFAFAPTDNPPPEGGEIPSFPSSRPPQGADEGERVTSFRPFHPFRPCHPFLGLDQLTRPLACQR